MPSQSDPTVITPGLLRDWAMPVPEGGKSARGTVLVVGGSRFVPGAVLLAGLAALRAGAGVLQLASAESGAAALSIEVPEALVVGLPETGDGAVAGDIGDRLTDLAGAADAIAIGPGLTDIEQTRALLRRTLAVAGDRTALVLDAYALGALSHEPELLADRKLPAVLTPNMTEAEHLLGHEPGDDVAAAGVELADRYGCVVALRSHVAAPDGRI
ncbi:NAD(P)H-hydrate dehydratase, partial [Micromonospora zhanjiangensis]